MKGSVRAEVPIGNEWYMDWHQPFCGKGGVFLYMVKELLLRIHLFTHYVCIY